MTEDEKKKRLADFRKPAAAPDEEPQSDDELIAMAKRIMERLGIEGEISDPDEGIKK